MRIRYSMPSLHSDQSAHCNSILNFTILYKQRLENVSKILVKKHKTPIILYISIKETPCKSQGVFIKFLFNCLFVRFNHCHYTAVSSSCSFFACDLLSASAIFFTLAKALLTGGMQINIVVITPSAKR